MSTFLQKTFGGLSFPYYFRHFLFGLIIYIPYMYLLIDKQMLRVTPVILFTVFQFLYPYSRFVYESVIDYLMGDNIFFANGILVLITKLITIALCWLFSWAIAPIGLIYLYLYHTKEEKKADINSQENIEN